MQTRLMTNKENALGKRAAVATRGREFGRDITNEVGSLMDVESYTSHDPLTLPYYSLAISDFLLSTESRYQALHGYLSRHAEITEKMRAILIDWLIEVHLKFKLLPETLFLTVNLLDRVLERVPVSKSKLQLIGVVALLIACKYEEIYSPEVRDMVVITDNAYTREEILSAEVKVLQTLEYNLTTPSAFRFLERFGKVAGVSQHTEMLSRYILELSLVEYRMLKYRPSLIACSALYLASQLDRHYPPWSFTLSSLSHCIEAELKECAKDLCVLLQGAERSSLQAVRKKFTSGKYLEVANVSVFQAATPRLKPAF